MPARKVRTKVSDDQAWVQRIKAAKLEERLAKHAKGEIEMSATQVRAAEILLRKIRPDLKAVDHTGETKHVVLTVAEQIKAAENASDSAD